MQSANVLRERLLRLLLVGLLFCAAAAPQSGPLNRGCRNSTVDVYGPKLAAKARAFLEELKAAIRAEDTQKVASMATYPLVFFSRGRKLTIPDRAQFLSMYKDVITPDVRRAVLQQSSKCLFGNWQGATVGSGQLWFCEQSDGAFKIISVCSECSDGGKSAL